MRSRNLHLFSLLVIASLLVGLTACATPAPPAATEAPAPTATEPPAPEPTPTIPPPPEDVTRALPTLRARFHPQEVRLLGWEKVDWPDGCLGIPMRDACMERVVSGYRILVEVGGQEYEYRSTLLDAQPYRLLLAAGPDHGIEEAALVWEGQEDGCKSLLLAPDGRAAIGPCDAPHEPLRLTDHTYLDHWLRRFAPFQAETLIGHVIFSGQGTEKAAPAWQRAIVAWARLVRRELWMGRSGASWGAALAWHREIPERPGYCQFLAVETYGFACASVARCEGGDARDLGRGWLETAEWERFDSWFYGRSPVYLPDLDLFSIGSQEMSDTEVDALRRWAEAVYHRLATSDLTVEE